MQSVVVLPISLYLSDMQEQQMKWISGEKADE